MTHRFNLFFIQFLYFRHSYTNRRWSFKYEIDKWGVFFHIGKGPYRKSHLLIIYIGISKRQIKDWWQIREMKRIFKNLSHADREKVERIFKDVQ